MSVMYFINMYNMFSIIIIYRSFNNLFRHRNKSQRSIQWIIAIMTKRQKHHQKNP